MKPRDCVTCGWKGISYEGVAYYCRNCHAWTTPFGDKRLMAYPKEACTRRGAEEWLVSWGRWVRQIIVTMVCVPMVVAQINVSKKLNVWNPDSSSMKVVYYSQWLDNLRWDTLALRPHQYFTDSLEGGRFTVILDTVTGRGSLRRSWFSTFWIKAFGDSTISSRDTFSLPIFPYGFDIVKYPSDSLRFGEYHTFIIPDSSATECAKIEPLTITGSGATLQTRIRYCRTGIPNI